MFLGITQKKIVRRIFKKGECKGDVVYRDDWLAVVVRRYVFLSRACVFDRFLAVDLFSSSQFALSAVGLQ